MPNRVQHVLVGVRLHLVYRQQRMVYEFGVMYNMCGTSCRI